ncbi:MAG: alpha/beta fold hydrolase [Bacteroidota bacterium]|nr:alpha/beta fold hydrolase [Bacteroidota bacterium]
MLSKDKNSHNPIFKNKKQEIFYYQSYENTLNEWPVKPTEKDITTSFGTAHISVCGPESAPPVILLHGMDASSTMWYPNILSLSQNHRVYTIDYIAEPGKSKPEKDFKNIEDIARWYDEIFTTLQLNEIQLVGASRGGWLSVAIALHSKARVKNIVLLSPAQTFKLIKPNGGIFRGILDEADVQRHICELDIGIATLLDDEFHHSKSAFKLKQYLTNGIPVLSSDLPENNLFIQDNKNGFICRKPSDFVERIQQINAMSQEKYSELITQCRSTISMFDLNNYCMNLINHYSDQCTRK